jgi:hypothetical protein
MAEPPEGDDTLTAGGSAAGRSFFVDEARVVARLNHPNIVKIHGFNPDNQPPYYLVVRRGR